MSLIIRFVILVFIAASIYALWPRTPNLQTFNPTTLAQLELETWKTSNATGSLNCVSAFYKIYDLQYGLAPLTAITMAQNSARALHLFRKAPDAMDQDKALPFLHANFVAIKSAIKAPFDASLAAQQLLSIWVQSAESTPATTLARSVADYWATLYGKPASAFTLAANAYADALLAGGFGPGQSADWNRVNTSLTQAYQELATALK